MNNARPYYPAMGPRIPRRRKPVRKDHDEQVGSPLGDVKTLKPVQDGAHDSLLVGRKTRLRGGPVTHRSPSPDDMLLPCCGRPLSEVAGRDQVTTDPAQVTCQG
jgi:hypothetical protein